MVFSTNTLLLTKEKAFPIKEDYRTNNLESFSFFIEALNMISEEQKIIHSIFAESYNNEVICNEGKIATSLLIMAIKKIDFKKIITNIMKRFVDLLERLWNSFHARLLDFLGDNNVIKHYKSKIMSIDSPVEFDEDRFIFTNLGLSTSYTSFKNELEKEYNSLVLNLSKFADFKTYEGLFKDIQSMKDNMDLSDNFFDELRGKIVGSYNSVSREEFGTELYNYFRNNGNVIPAGNISPQEIKMACNSYFDYSKDIKRIKKDKSDLKEAAKRIEKDILNVNLENYVKENIPDDAQKMFISLLQDKAKRVNLICNIYIQVFSAKLDATKDAFVQYKKMLMVASKKIVKEGL